MGTMTVVLWSLMMFLLTPYTTYTMDYDPNNAMHHKVNTAMEWALYQLKERTDINIAFLNNDTDQVDDTQTSKGQLNLFTFEESEAKNIDYLSQISLDAAEKLMNMENMTIEELQSSAEWRESWQAVFRQFCIHQIQPYECDIKARYRTMDGSCNNLRHPHWGKSFIPQERLMDAQYDDDIESPRTEAKDGSDLPNARHISNILFRSKQEPQHHDLHSVMVMAWGQFIDHDLVKTPASTGENGSSIQCCGLEENRKECFPLSIPNNDPHFTNQTCMNFVRSSPATSQDCNLGVREQLNSVTAYIDASTVYGSTYAEAKSLRDESGGGRLKVLAGNMPPKWLDTKCKIKNPHADFYCMLAGDGRVNVIPNLSALHIMFIREHNRVVSRLSKENPEWDDERLYQEGRKIIAAYMQHFTYDEYLLTVLNGDFMSRYRLYSYPYGINYSYRPHKNPGILNVFAVAAFRFGHSQISNHQALADENGSMNRSFPIEDCYHDPEMLQEKNCKENCPGIANWLITDTCTRADQYFDKGVRDLLFLDNKGHSFDLPALNIMRGRDHGIPSYTAWRKKLGLSKVTSFEPDDEYGLIDHTPEAADLLKQAYRHVDDIDLYAGAISERHLPGADVGPVFSKLIAKQFRLLKEGDRFWYENGQKRIGFTQDQILSIKRVKLAKIVCENMNVSRVQENVMFKPNLVTNKPVSCENLPDLDFTLWKE